MRTTTVLRRRGPSTPVGWKTLDDFTLKGNLQVWIGERGGVAAYIVTALSTKTSTHAWVKNFEGSGVLDGFDNEPFLYAISPLAERTPLAALLAELGGEIRLHRIF